MSTGTGGGLQQLFTTSSYKNDLKGLSLVWSTDRLFKRRGVSGPALDAYVIGESPVVYTDTYTAVGGETELTFTLEPVLSVDRVVVDLVEWTEGALTNGWSFQKDESVEYRESTRAVDKLILSTPLMAGQQVSIDYTYDRLCYGLQALYDMGYSMLFDTDCLLRRIWRHSVELKVRITALASANVVEVHQEALNIILDFLNPPNYVEYLSPKMLRDELMEYPTIHGSSGGLSQVDIQTFTSKTAGTAEVEVVYFNTNELSFADETLIDLKVVQ
jgi:hypothetical protein